jgi:sterol desaturase/sphingolipid hydroxylase (fatty acid hydroxylase superfamily)
MILLGRNTQTCSIKSVEQLESLLDRCSSSVIQGVIVLSIGFVLFSLIERIFSLSSAKKPFRSTLLDLQYAFISMLYPPFIYFIISAIFGYVTVQTQRTVHNPHFYWLIFVAELSAVLFARDCLIYLHHRIFHLRPVWAFHSIHHSSEEVNWISAVRFHPAENIIEASGEVLLFLVCDIIGVEPAVLSLAAVTIGFYNLFIHSNLRWTFGPLRYVIVSPVFHRWHHSDLPEARDKNFAAMFSLLDLVLGTFYMPKDAMPETTGLSAQEKTIHPHTLGGQLLYPFRKR